MADRYYVNSSNTKEIQTVYIRRNEERIILIGTQQHRPITGPKSFIGSFVYDVNKWSKMMFDIRLYGKFYQIKKKTGRFYYVFKGMENYK